MCRSRGCGLLSQVSCYEHYNVTVYLWVSQFVYHWYHLLGVDLYTVYSVYKLSCALRRTALFCVSLLYSSTCNSVRG